MPNILILALNTETKLMTRLPLTPPNSSRNAKLASNVPPSLQMKPESNNSTLKKCGNPLTAPSVTSLTGQYSDNPSSSKTYPVLSHSGTNLLLLVDMLSVTNTTPLIFWLSLDSLSQGLRENKCRIFTSLRAMELYKSR